MDEALVLNQQMDYRGKTNTSPSFVLSASFRHFKKQLSLYYYSSEAFVENGRIPMFFGDPQIYGRHHMSFARDLQDSQLQLLMGFDQIGQEKDYMVCGGWQRLVGPNNLILCCKSDIILCIKPFQYFGHSTNLCACILVIMQ